jgi:hypothetical protein
MISRRQYLLHKVTNAVLWSLLLGADTVLLTLWFLGLLVGGSR